MGGCNGISPMFVMLAMVMVGVQGHAPLVADTGAFQVMARANASRTELTAETVKTRMWVSGTAGENVCPAGSVPITQDECEAFAMMDFNPELHSLLMPPFPQSSAIFPKGCSIMYSGNMFRYFFYNTHPTGAPFQGNVPACKDDPWVMYKAACPTGKISVSVSECIDFAGDKHHYVWNGQISSPTDPPGCFGRGGSGLVDSSDVGKVYYNTHAGVLTNQLTFPVCTTAPTAAPTPAPTDVGTPVPTSSPSSGGTTSAVGDPHMTTLSGVKFDIMRAGTHVLLQIPQRASARDSLLRVQAAVQHEGDKCEDMYIKVLNITGMWADERLAGGLSFVTQRPGSGGQAVAPTVGSASWMRLGMVDLKVVRGKTRSGALYLNVYARKLRATSKRYPIGGILGLDDFTEASTPAPECAPKVLSLLTSPSNRA